MAMKPFTVLGFVLLMSLLAIVSATETKTVEPFDVTKESYVGFMRQKLYKEVLKTTTAQVQRLPQLGTQKLSKEPDTWIHVPFKVGSTLAIRSDNMYLSGFKARDGSWFSFKGTPPPAPTAKALSFAGDYRSLTGKGYKDMENVAVGKAATVQAATTLADYKIGGAIPEEEVRKALATMVLAFCEGQRFVVVQQNITELWEAGGQVSTAGLNLLVLWKDTSCALLEMQKKKKKKWESIPEATKIKNYGDPAMKDAKAAAANLYFVLSATELRYLVHALSSCDRAQTVAHVACNNKLMAPPPRT